MQYQHRMWIVASLMCVLGAVATPWQDTRAQPAQEQKAHQHTTPHGGQMVTAGKYHLELVLQPPQTVQVYLYDAASQPLTVPTPEATLYLRLPGNTMQTLTLSAVGGQAATAWAATTEVVQNVSAFEAALRVTLDGETRNIRFASTTAPAH